MGPGVLAGLDHASAAQPTGADTESGALAPRLRAAALELVSARGELCSGAVEGLNNKIRLVTRRSYGFRTYRAMEAALYHNLGRLPDRSFPMNSVEQGEKES